MDIYLTSSPFSGHEDPANSHTECKGLAISELNEFADRLRKSAEGCRHGLMIASAPDDSAFTERISEDMRSALERSGITFDTWQNLDRRNAAAAASLVTRSDFFVLAGGHTPTQNRFFREISLKELIHDRMQLPGPSVLVGISAGSMNAAETVYAQPEEAGESRDPKYERFLTGLGLTSAMIIPHFQRIRECVLDGKRLFEEISAPDSMGRCFYLMSDGSYLYIRGEMARIYGSLHIMKDGAIRKIADHGGVTALIT